jgi:hypothetical protein
VSRTIEGIEAAGPLFFQGAAAVVACAAGPAIFRPAAGRAATAMATDRKEMKGV